MTGSTGTVYALIDPRDQVPRYIGGTRQPLAARLKGHLGTKAAPKVRAWVTELRAAGLVPIAVPVKENVPAGELLAAENAEITRILAAGGELLNESATAEGRELNNRRYWAERAAAERAGWHELTGVALAVFSGPLAPPADLDAVTIPDQAWAFMSQRDPGAQRMSDRTERYGPWTGMSRDQQDAARELWLHVRALWGPLRGLAGEFFDRQLEGRVALATGIPFATRGDASRYLALVAWYMVVVGPWRHLAVVAGLPMDDGSFISWAGREPAVRNALEFLAGCADDTLVRLSPDWDDSRRRWHDEGPGRLLATTAAAYQGRTPAPAIQPAVVAILQKLAEDHQLTQPLADLLLAVDPKALDTAFGPDVAAELDAELGLAPGAAGQVARALARRLRHTGCRPLQCIADRSAQLLPVRPLPDYGRWEGNGVPASRVVSALLVRAGLGVPERSSPTEYMAEVRELWTPSLAWMGQQVA